MFKINLTITKLWNENKQMRKHFVDDYEGIRDLVDLVNEGVLLGHLMLRLAFNLLKFSHCHVSLFQFIHVI